MLQDIVRGSAGAGVEMVETKQLQLNLQKY